MDGNIFIVTKDIKINMTETVQNQSDTDLSPNFSDFQSIEKPFDIPYIRGLYITLFGAIFACCVLGNITVIYVILCHKKMRNVTNFFLANLAVSDLCVGVFCVLPNLSTYLSTIWYLGRAMCKMYYFIQCTSYTASVLILTVISLERYFAIIHPMLNRRISRMYLLKCVIVVVWALAAIYGIPNLIAYDIFSISTWDTNNSTIEFCVNIGEWNIDMEIYSIVNFAILYLVPLIMITTMYIQISIVLWKSSTPHAKSHPARLEMQSSKSTTSSQVKCEYCGKCLILNRTNNKGGADKSVSHAANGDEKLTEGKISLLKRSNKWDDTVEESSSIEQNCTCPCEKKSGGANCHRKYVTLSVAKGKPKGQAITRALQARRKVIRLLICIIVSFALCVLPHHVRILWQYWSPPQDSFNFGHMLIPPSTFLLFYANSALNPFLYALLSEHFRKACRDLFTGCCKKHGQRGGSATYVQSRMRQGSLYSDITTSFQTTSTTTSPARHA